VAFGVPWIQHSLSTVSTDDAYVNSYVTFVAPRVSGQVLRVLVDDNNRVNKGDVLVQLDPEPFQVQVAIRQAAVDTAQASLVVAEATVRSQLGLARGYRFKLPRRLVRYRAPAHVCNACSIKHLCTGSEEGREIEHNPDSWLESEIARFHRGISLALLFLAGLLLVVEMIWHQRPIELLILSGFLVPIALLVSQLSAAFLAPRGGSR
jgi:hypothetical protein